MLHLILNVYQTTLFKTGPNSSVDANSEMAQMIKFPFDVLENIVEKGENAGLPAFSPFPSMFSKSFL